VAYFVYILRCADGTLYTGSTNDVQARLLTHNSGRGAKYTAGRRPVRIVYSEEHESRSSAQRREHQLKRWTRAKKEALIAGDPALLKRLRRIPPPSNATSNPDRVARSRDGTSDALDA
jgi:putative endonuclease